MNRIVKQDYERLVEYFSLYNLKEVCTDTAFLKQLKTLHRKLYAYLLFLREAEDTNYYSNSTVTSYYDEAGSDLILSLFCWTNGAYKPAEFQLRSCIENFLKASLYLECNDIINNKSVSEIMEYSSSSQFFHDDFCQKKLLLLKNTYSSLCAFVHSSPDKLTSHSALIQLPQYNAKYSKEYATYYTKVLDSILGTIYFINFKAVFKMHSLNRELFLQGLSSSDKKIIYEQKSNF
ncbi:hypothetical protein [Dorea amylophila]|uniref:hypothetical protein n=1 Tax=Dorea amylophila TaxID=2981789 RepID=UPI0022E29C4A|nr:hypothetical protein [Dorea amylophila]